MKIIYDEKIARRHKMIHLCAVGLVAFIGSLLMLSSIAFMFLLNDVDGTLLVRRLLCFVLFLCGSYFILFAIGNAHTSEMEYFFATEGKTVLSHRLTRSDKLIVSVASDTGEQEDIFIGGWKKIVTPEVNKPVLNVNRNTLYIPHHRNESAG